MGIIVRYTKLKQLKMCVISTLFLELALFILFYSLCVALLHELGAPLPFILYFSFYKKDVKRNAKIDEIETHGEKDNDNFP